MLNLNDLITRLERDVWTSCTWKQPLTWRLLQHSRAVTGRWSDSQQRQVFRVTARPTGQTSTDIQSKSKQQNQRSRFRYQWASAESRWAVSRWVLPVWTLSRFREKEETITWSHRRGGLRTLPFGKSVEFCWKSKVQFVHLLGSKVTSRREFFSGINSVRKEVTLKYLH